MKRITFSAALLALLLAASAATAQVTKTIPGEKKTATATIEAIQANTRELTVKLPDGTSTIIVVGPDVKQFDSMKVGDVITATYYDNVVLRLKPHGEAPVDSATSAITSANQAKPGGTAAVQRTITVTITAIDPKVPSITFKGPSNWTYSSRVQDKDALAKVKVGDQVDITWTEALLISVTEPKKK